jgi:uncharacterized membrane protein YccC
VKELQSIRERNKRVELDKAWETSLTRRTVIAVLTYFFVVIFLLAIGAPRPWLSALVPAIGFILSTLSMPLFRRYWEKHIR